MLESLFKKVAGLKTCNFIKKRVQHRCHKKETAEAVVRRYSSKQVFSKFCKVNMKMPVLQSPFNTVLISQLLLRRDSRFFPVKFEKFLRISFLNASAAILLHIRVGSLDWN